MAEEVLVLTSAAPIPCEPPVTITVFRALAFSELIVFSIALTQIAFSGAEVDRS